MKFMAEKSRTTLAPKPAKTAKRSPCGLVAASRWSLGLFLLPWLALAGGCDSTEGGHAMKTRGIFTTVYTPELSPLNTFTMPGSGYFPCDNFGPDETPVAIVAGFSGTSVTMELADLTTGETLMSEDHNIAPGKDAVKPLLLNHSGEYEVRLLLRDSQIDSYKFSVTREPLTTGGGEVNYDAVISRANDDLQVDAGNGLAYIARGSAHAGKRELDAAIADYTEALRLRPYDATAHVLRGMAYSKQHKWDEAIADMTEVIRLKPDDPRGPGTRAVFYERSGDYEKAIADLREALRIFPAYAAADNELAWLLATCPREDLRNGKESVALATSACEATAWKRSQFIDTLAAACAENGDFESAVKYQKQAMDGQDTTAATRLKYAPRLLLYEQHQAYHQSQNREVHAP
jgi:tetratricopeptide (TPR) repeat protein